LKTAPASRREPGASYSLTAAAARCSSQVSSRSAWLAMVAFLVVCWTDAVAADCVSPIQVHVSFAPGTVTVDAGKSSRKLEQIGIRSGAIHQLGVTRATPQHTVRIQIDERERCVRPVVTLQLTVRPLQVELARELEQSVCLRKYVLDHELQHVAIYNAAMTRAAVQVEREMRAQIIVPLERDGARAERLQAEVYERWLPRLEALVAQSAREHEALDVDQEARAHRACSSEIALVMKAVR